MKLMDVVGVRLIIGVLVCSLTASGAFDTSNIYDDNRVVETDSRSINKEFWEQIYQNSMLNTRTRYNVLNDERVCFTCPIDRTIFQSLYAEAMDQTNISNLQSLPPLTITWAAQLNEQRVLFFCRNNSRLSTNPIHLSSNDLTSSGPVYTSTGTELEYSCENHRLCLTNVKNSFPKNYQCFVKSYVLNVRLDVIVQLQYVMLYFAGDSVKFDYQKEVQVQEGQEFTIKCEVPETNPVSVVSAYIDNKEVKLTGLDKKTLDNRMTINTYSFVVNATRWMNGKSVKCEAQMRDLPTDLADSIDLKSHMSKDYTIAVHYPPTCNFQERTYRTGINRSIIIECPVNSSNPDVTHYKMILPSTRTNLKQIDNTPDILRKVGRFQLMPSSIADFGLYECIPRSLAGTTKCDINVELGATPNAPEQCLVQFAKVNNKTFAQFSCKPGYNQGGSSSFLTIYEIVDKQLKLSGRVNIDESKLDKEVPYITPADEDKYYEFLIMQENNFGNSTSVLLTLGTLPINKSSSLLDFKNYYSYIAAGAGFLLLVCICSCCCCSDVCSSKSEGLCKCCSADHMDDEGLTYKKAPLDADTLGMIGSPSNGHTGLHGYSSDLNGTLKMNAYNSNSNYDYYDNTGLLEADTAANMAYERNSKLGSLNAKNANNSNGNGNGGNNNLFVNRMTHGHEEEYEEGEEEEEEEDDDEMNVVKHGYIMKRSDLNYINDECESPVDSANRQRGEEPYTDENPDDSLSSNDQKSSSSSSGIGILKQPPVKPSFNTNVNVHIGSGVESIKKHTYGLMAANNGTEIYSKTKKQQLNRPPPNGNLNNNNANMSTSSSNNSGVINRPNSNYSTIDRKKFIKADNGLVYTSINKTIQKSELAGGNNNHIISDEEYMVMHHQTAHIANNAAETEDTSYDYDNFDNHRNRLLSNGNAPYGSMNRQSKVIRPTHPNNMFQVELNQKLKSINTNPNQLQPNGGDQHHQMSNSTGTTSVSSASSCASNSDLIIKRESTNGGGGSGAENGKTYSLLKTTINMNGQTSTPNTNPNQTGTLGRQSKPPILKPKPRNNGIYQTVNNNGTLKKHLNTTSDSLHNQSTEPLLNGNHHQSTNHNNNHHHHHQNGLSLQTSPSTSVTDVSSTNCTPQHNQSNLVEELTLKSTQLTRSRSNSLTRNGTNNNNTISKVTTTFGPTTNNVLYSTVKTNNETTTTNGPLKTFAPSTTNTYESLSNTANRNRNLIGVKKNPSPVEDSTPRPNTTYETLPNRIHTQQRTMERRHVQNSEI